MAERNEQPDPTAPQPWSKVLIASFVVLGLLASVVAVARYTPITNRFFSDADSIREPAASVRPRGILWQPAKPLSEIINTTIDDYEPKLSADGLTLFFVRGKAGTNADIFVSTKLPTGWTEPTPVMGVNSEHDELGPEPSPDGQALYFYSDRPGGAGGYDLWVAHRSGSRWLTPVNLGEAVNSEFNDYGPALTPDGETLYFASNRPRVTDDEAPDPDAWRATIREDLVHRDYDLYSAAVSDRGVAEATPLTSLNTSGNEGAPAVSSFGDFLYFASDRPGGEGGFDLYRAWRLRGDHQPVENLGSSVNTEANELDPGLSLGGYALYFSSDRIFDPNPTASVPSIATATKPEGRRTYNLYYTTSREVFSEIERLERPPIDWAALWSQIGPHVLWAVLLLLLLWLLYALLRDARGRRLSLLAKCLLGSVAAHLLLLLLMNVWAVTTSIAKGLRHRGRIQIALASPAAGNDLFNQLRGQFTSVEAPAPPTLSSQRQSIDAVVEVQAATATLDITPHTMPVDQQPRVESSVADAAVPQREELRDISAAITANLTPVRIPTTLPAEATRVDASESSASSEAKPITAEPTDRPPMPKDVATESALAASVAVQSTNEVVDATASAESMATTADAPDAAPQTTNSADWSSSLPSAVAENVPRATTLELPAAPVERAPEAAEVEPRVTVQATATARPALTPEAVLRATTTATSQLQPERAATEHADASFADATSPTEAEVGESSSTRDLHDGAAPSAEVVLPSPEGLTLATPAGGAPVNDAEPELSVSPRGTADSRRSFDTSVKAEGAGAASLAVESSVASALTDSESTLADSPTALDVAPKAYDGTSAMATASGADMVLPNVTAFALPTLEQGAAATLAEPTTEVESMRQESPRAALPLASALADATVSRSEFLPESSEAMLDGARSNTLADVTLHERTADELPPSFPDLLPGTDVSLVPPSFALDLSLPTETQAPENPYAQRFLEDRLSVVERMGGSRKTEEAVAAALAWLARHQSDDGHWDGDRFDRGCNRCGGETDVAADRALTGLALLAFMGAGHSPLVDGPYRDTVSRGLQWLLDRQDDGGDLRGEETMYTHGIVSIALSEAYGITHDPDLADPVRRAVGFIERARNREDGGWRYDPGQPGDTSVLGWQVMALKSAHLSGIRVSAESFNAGRVWLEKVSRRSRPGLYSYQPNRSPTPSMTAEGMFVQQLLGRRREDPMMAASADYVVRHLPDWSSEPRTYFWYYATLALYQHGGEHWRTWNDALVPQLLNHQRQDPGAVGSWNPDGEWAETGGRVYQTALCTLMLEVYYRYLPLYTVDQPIDAIGAIVGKVTDATTGAAVPGAAIRLNLPDRDTIVVTADAMGRYSLSVPEVPDFFALSASRKGFVPHSRNVDAAMLSGAPLSLDFRLVPANEAVVAVESIPDVHHLGDNNFDGTINSQFQKESEGARFSATFTMKRTQLPPRFTRAEVRLLAKGVQRRHRLVINGVDVDRRLRDSPNDGSFGEFVASFDPEVLRAGDNKIEIIARPSSGDIDDFEFVNVRILLAP